jgi:uncharacterized protein
MPSTLLTVRVTPRSSQAKLELQPDGSVRVWVMAAPTDGQANKAVCELVAKALGVSKTSVQVEKGETGRDKKLRVDGLAEAEVRAKLT